LGAASSHKDLYDYLNGIKLLHAAASLERGALLPVIYMSLQSAYWNIGFPEKSLQYLNHYLSVTKDSITYYLMRYLGEFLQGNQEDANKSAKSAFAIDSTSIDAILYMGSAFLYSKRYEEAYTYYSRYFSQLETTGDLDVNDMNRMGYTLWMVGKRDEARYYFNQMIEHCRRHIGMNSSYGREGATFDIAGVYAFLGEKDSAYLYLEELTKTNWQVAYCLNMLNGLDPLFESIRQEERFQLLVGKMEAKYQAEHERVKQWLEENDMM
jgi:tetratricopeptide (TPR) repeat protein